MEPVEIKQELKIPPNTDPSQEKGFLIVKSANQWIEEAKERPTPQMLFSEFWHEGELCIMFATTGAGKSILATQIGFFICLGQQIPGFKNEAIAQPVLYFDFELSDKQFQTRYSEQNLKYFENSLVFPQKFFRVELNPNADKPENKSVEVFLIESIERSVQETGAKVLIIDNITYLSGDAEKAKDALPLMKKLKVLKTKYNLSLLVLAHTPKRDASKPITKNDLSGSIMLMNFCDSSFTIGTGTSDPSVRYIKQIKERSTENLYGEDNIIVCLIEKQVNFLQFIFKGFGKEGDYLKPISASERQVTEEKVYQRHSEGKSYREIAKELNISHMTVKRILTRKDDKVNF